MKGDTMERQDVDFDDLAIEELEEVIAPGFLLNE
jgi:hypothetical protein